MQTSSEIGIPSGEWRVIPSHPLYMASAEGSIFSRRTGRVLSPSKRKDGYLGYSLSVKGVLTYINGHRLVCEAFHGRHPENKPLALHGNGNRSDNRAENLRWGTQSENLHDRVKHGNCHETRKTHCPQGHPYSPDNTYQTPGGRKCKVCVGARAKTLRKRLQQQGIPWNSDKHGTRNGYNTYGCRCTPCKHANTEHARERRV